LPLDASNPRRALVPWGPARSNVTSGTGVLLLGRGCVTYLEAYETTGSASGGVTIYDGGSSNGQQLFDYTLTEGESTSEFLGLHWVQFTEGLYLVTNTGSVAGSLTAWLDHDCAAYNGAQYHATQLQAVQLELMVAAYGGNFPPGVGT
jgi:hypothetical protein